MYITCTDYATKAIKRLKRVFLECDNIKVFDIINDSWPIAMEKEFVLLNRIDTEFDDATLKNIYSIMSNNGIENILVIPTHILTLQYWLNFILRIIKNKIMKRKMVFAGYSRTKSRFIELFEKNYFILKEKNIDGTCFFLLKRKK